MGAKILILLLFSSFSASFGAASLALADFDVGDAAAIVLGIGLFSTIWLLVGLIRTEIEAARASRARLQEAVSLLREDMSRHDEQIRMLFKQRSEDVTQRMRGLHD